MRSIFSTISFIHPKKAIIPTLLVTGAAVSLTVGQIALASVFAVAALGSKATFNQSQKQLYSQHEEFMIKGKSDLSRKWFTIFTDRSDEEALENQKPGKVMNEDGEIVDRTEDTKVIYHVTDERFLEPFLATQTKQRALIND